MSQNIHRRFVWFIVIVSLPLVVFVFYLNYSERKQLTQLKFNEIRTISGLISAEYQNIIDNTKHLLVALSQNPTINQSPVTCSAYLGKLITQYQRYYNFGVTDSEGKVICSALPTDQIMANVAGLAVFRNTKKNQAFSYGEYRISQTNKPVISFGYPLKQGIIFSSLDLSWLNQFGYMSIDRNNMVITLTDHNGIVVARSPDAQNWIGQQFPLAELTKNVNSSIDGVALSNGIDGITRYYTYSRLDATEESLYAIIGYPQNLTNQQADRNFHRRLLLTLLVLVISIGFSWYLGNKLIMEQVDALTRIDQLKNDFISLASHQIRTPLTAIKWFGELLSLPKTGQLNRQQKKMITDMNSSANKISHLISTLLDISKIENATSDVEKEKVDVIEMTKTIIDDAKFDLKTKKLKLSFGHPKKLPLVFINQKLVAQAITNLLNNAIKYAYPETEIQVKLFCKNGQICLAVSDKGVVISSKQKGLLFNKFSRTPESISYQPEGSGLGLYLAKLIVELHQGQIWFKSNSARTTFYFSLPLVSSS